MLGGNLLPPQILLIPVAKLSEVMGIYDQLYALIGVQVGFGVGFYVFVLHGFMRAIPDEIQQAAVIDGASPWQIYWRIILPLARPALAALSALSFTWIFNDLLWAITVLRTDTRMPITAALHRTAGPVRVHVERDRRRIGDRRRPHRRRLPPLPAPLRRRTEPRSRQVTPHDRWLLRTDTTTYAVTLGPRRPLGRARRLGPARRRSRAFADGPVAAHPLPHPRRRRPCRVHPVRAAPLHRRRPDRPAPGRRTRQLVEVHGAAPDGDRALRLDFTDDVLGLRTTLCYETVPGTDVVLRWTELTCTGESELRLERFDSAAVNVPVQAGARLTYLAGQWSQEFQLRHMELARGRFEMESTQGFAGHAYAPWLAIQDSADPHRRRHPHLRRRPGMVRQLAHHRRRRARRLRYGSAPAGCRMRAPSASPPAPPSPRPRLACAFSPRRPRRTGPCLAPLRAHG